MILLIILQVSLAVIIPFDGSLSEALYSANELGGEVSIQIPQGNYQIETSIDIDYRDDLDLHINGGGEAIFILGEGAQINIPQSLKVDGLSFRSDCPACNQTLFVGKSAQVKIVASEFRHFGKLLEGVYDLDIDTNSFTDVQSLLHEAQVGQVVGHGNYFVNFLQILSIDEGETIMIRNSTIIDSQDDADSILFKIKDVKNF